MKYTYNTSGTCSRKIDFEINDGKLGNITFLGGCNGNLKGLSVLLEGMDAKTAAEKLKGIKCGFKSTSCPDQLARAIEKALNA